MNESSQLQNDTKKQPKQQFPHELMAQIHKECAVLCT